jgi:YVTN family beta-propeller protein
MHPSIRQFVVLTLLPVLAAPGVQAAGQGLPTQTWPAGQHIVTLPNGGRMLTLHRGILMLAGESESTNNGVFYYDISNPVSPRLLASVNTTYNGHMWWKFGDMFIQEYFNPQLNPQSQFQDLSVIPVTKAWSGATPLKSPTGIGWRDLATFPILDQGSSISDQRTGQVVNSNVNLAQMAGGGEEFEFRFGNLLFFVAGEMDSPGISVLDVGDPTKPIFLGKLPAKLNEYANFAVWRNYLIFVEGNLVNWSGNPANLNEAGNNLVAIDFSDPRNLKYGFGYPKQIKPDSSWPAAFIGPNATDGPTAHARYIGFQDQYGFMAQYHEVFKIDMEKHQVVQTFDDVDAPDFMPTPLGHLLAVPGEGGTQIWSLGPLDTTPPSLGYYLPRNGAVNQPRSTVIGLVINETLDGTTLNSQNIVVRPAAGGAAIATDIMNTSYGVINVVPRAPLAADTAYIVDLVAGGIKDVAGNGIAATQFSFSTGAGVTPINQPPVFASLNVAPVSPATTGTPVTFTANASDPESGPLQYSWQFGDGTAATPFIASSSIQHTYTSPGSYTILAQVKDDQGEIASRNVPLIVSQAGVDLTPAGQDGLTRLRSTPIAVDAVNRRVWVANPDSDSVTLLNPDTMVKTREIAVGRHPEALAVDALGAAWVVCRNSDEIRVVNAAGSTVRTLTLPRGSRPVSVVMTRDGKTAYVAEYATGRVRRFATATYSDNGALDIGPTPSALALSPDGTRLLVSRFISPDAGGTIWSVNTQTWSAAGIAAIALPKDDAPNVENGSSARGIPNYISGLALTPDGKKGWYAAKKDNIFRGLLRDGQPLDHDNMIRTLVGTIDPVAGVDDTTARKDIDNTSQPTSVLASPYGGHLFATLQGNNRVVVLDPGTAAAAVLAQADVGKAPQGMALDITTGRIFVQNFMDRSVTVLDAGSLIKTGTGGLPVAQTISTVATETLPAAVLQGKKIFYNAADPRMSLEGYLSCAICHQGGDHDGRSWDFTQRGEGLRRSIALKGHRGVAQGRLHWTGNFDELQDFEQDIRTSFSGSGFLTDDQFNTGTRSQPLGAAKAGLSSDLDALAAYLTSLNETDPSPFKTSSGGLTAQAQSGKLIFQRQKCAVCHNGNDFTDSPARLVHDVGTIKPSSGQRLGAPLLGFDTPTLKGLWETVRFLHDGLSATLVDVLSNPVHTGGPLTASEINDVAAYLLQIDDGETQSPQPLALAITSSVKTANPGEFTVTVSTGLPMSRVDLYVNGALSAQAQLQADGSYLATIQIPSGATLEARGTRAAGGISITGTGGSACDINLDATINVQDIQLAVNQALGVSVCSNADLDHDGICNVLDVQRLYNAALGGSCLTP